MDGGLVGFVGFAQNMMHTNEAFNTHIEVGGAWTVPNRCAWEPDIPEQDCDAMTIESQQVGTMGWWVVGGGWWVVGGGW